MDVEKPLTLSGFSTSFWLNMLEVKYMRMVLQMTAFIGAFNFLVRLKFLAPLW